MQTVVDDLTKLVLPEANEFDKAFRISPWLWQSALQSLARSLGQAAQLIRPVAAGSNLLAILDERVVLKVYPRFHRHQWESETRVLAHLQGKLSFPIPALLEFGQASDDWFFVLMTLLPGTTLDYLWPQMTLEQKAQQMFAIGTMMREIQAVKLGELRHLPPDWSTFIAAQRQLCFERHKRLGVPERFLSQLPGYLQTTRQLLPENFEAVILTGEYTPFNLMVPIQGICDRPSGVIDFADAMVGFAEYDLLGPAMFLGEGNPQLISALLEGYGLVRPSYELQQRLMLLQLLHRYSDIKAQASVSDWFERADSWQDVAQVFFPM